MYTGSTRGLETLVQDMESTLTDEYPAALATLVWVDHVSHSLSNRSTAVTSQTHRSQPTP
jgi:hypothetical protein